MEAAAAPRLTGGFAASVVLHAGAIALLVFLKSGTPPPSAPVYHVQLLAAPAGEQAEGAVRNTPAPPAPVPPVPTVPKAAPAPPARKAVPKAPAKAAPPIAAQTAPKAAEQPKPVVTPTAGGGPTGSTGADVANVNTAGIDFPYPWYTNNITSKIIQQFHTAIRCTTEVRFVIHRDGSVDPDGIHLGASSCPYGVNLQAIGAVEAVAAAKLFGALPPGFHDDILPVTFRFTPSLFR